MTDNCTYQDKMKRIQIDRKYYDISFIQVMNHWCAYVILTGKNIKDAESTLDYCTYHEKNVFGVDTAHTWNSSQTLDAKYNDALYQIIKLIKSFNKA